MPLRDICPHHCYDSDNLAIWDVPAADLIIRSSLDAINTAATLGHIYPEIVQEFWGSAKFTEDDGLKGEFFDYVLNYNMKSISEVLRVPSEGAKFKTGWMLENDPVHIRKTVYGNGNLSAPEATKAANLTQPARVIHLLITNVYTPRLKYHDYVFEKDVFIMYHMLNNVPIDPVNLVYEHLKTVQANTAHAIPYGYLITHSLNKMRSHPFPGWSHFYPVLVAVMDKDIFLCSGVRLPDVEYEDEDSDMDSESEAEDK